MTEDQKAKYEEAKDIPQWILDYDAGNFKSSAGKAIRFLIERCKKLEQVCPNASECIHDDPKNCTCVQKTLKP